MNSRTQVVMKLGLSTILIIWLHTTTAEMLSEGDPLNELYNNILQSDSISHLDLPDNQIERKVQRSPRLRFGRRSDGADLFPHMAEKRWYGDVDQKPIRSKSLRLRFGRRSDPTMPLLNAPNQIFNPDGSFADNTDDYNDIYGNYFDRIARKPQRLRFGRSLPVQQSKAQQTHENAKVTENVP